MIEYSRSIELINNKNDSYTSAYYDQPEKPEKKEQKMSYGDTSSEYGSDRAPRSRSRATAETEAPAKRRTASASLAELANTNKEAGLRAVSIQTGRLALNVLRAQIVPRLPMWVQGYAEGPLANVVLANGVNLAVMWNLHRGNKLFEQLRDAMMEAAMFEVIEYLNPGKFISDFLAKVNLVDPQVLESLEQK